jgi:protein-disulfide isomerase
MALGAAAAIAVLPGGVRLAAAELPTLEKMLEERSVGSPDAKVTIHAYESLTCPHCASFHQTIMPDLKEQYIDTGKVRMVFHDFPHNPRDARAYYGHMLARCMGEDGYYPMLEALFANQAHWAGAPSDKFFQVLGQYGRVAGLSQQEFDSCMQNEELFNALQQRRQEIVQQVGINATPTFVIGDQKISGPQSIEDITTVIDPMLNE